MRGYPNFCLWILLVNVNVNVYVIGHSLLFLRCYTPNANMADHSVCARDESHESEVSQALMFCFDNAFPEKSRFVVDLVTLFRPLYPFLCS